MKTIAELIATQQELNAPTPPPVTPEDEKAEKHRRWLKKLIAAQINRIEKKWESVEVVLGEEIVTVSVGQLPGRDWVEIADTNPPTSQADENLGYDRMALPRAYLTDRIKLNNAPTDETTWQTVWDLLRSEDRKNVSAVMWWLNVGESEAELKRLKQEQRK